jgi:predicted transcriptional regulator of viral defense system
MPNFGKAYIKEFLLDLLERQLTMRVKKGLYVMLPYDTMKEDFFPNRHLTASAIVSNKAHYIGYYTALQEHDLTTQPSLVEQVVVDKQVKPSEQEIEDVRFQFIYHNEKHFFGTKKIWVEYMNQSYSIRCSDLEKTIIDCLYRPDYAGGIVEIAKAIYTAQQKFNYTRMLKYLEKMQSQAVIKRLGFLLELYEIETPIIAEMLALKTNSYVVLDPIHPKKGKTQSRWSIQMNTDIETIKQAPFS